MEFGAALASARKARGLTQEQLASRLYVTRQAVSRWERGEVVPGIDMIKLISNVLDEPLSNLLSMPDHFCQSCGMILAPDDCAPRLAENTGMTLDEAVSLMGAVLPQLERWRAAR